MKRLIIIVLLLVWAAPSLAAEITDDVGRTIRFDKPFSRIMSLYGAHTENLYSLGLADAIIGVGMNESYPPEVKKKQAFSYRAGAERILAVKPDLVLIRPQTYYGRQALIKQLSGAGITIAVLQPRTVDAMLIYWGKLGKLTGREKEAAEMVKSFKANVAELRARTADIPEEKRKRVYFETIHRKMKTTAPGSIAEFALLAAGGINVASDAPKQTGKTVSEYGKEHIIAKGGGIDIFLAQIGPMNQVTKEMIKAEPGFMAIKAVREGRVYLVPEDILSRPTYRLLGGIELLGSIFYPERFEK